MLKKLNNFLVELTQPPHQFKEIGMLVRLM